MLFLGEDTSEPFNALLSVSELPEGETVVIKAVATDALGRSTVITVSGPVVINRVPVPSCQNISVQLDATGNSSITANAIDDGSSDPDDGNIITLSATPTCFDCSDIGSNVATLTVTDDSGASSTCMATVTIVDTSPDFDGDGLGNFCDNDDDDDGVLDSDDRCPETVLNDPVNSKGCSIGQICVCTDKRNSHGRYVRCVVRISKEFRDAGLINWRDFSRYTVAAAKSKCGRGRINNWRWNFRN
ncbi:MAG: hypothetical protein D3924_08530 [Candidatus Electrothrix sp. AR4]|nr:hypothetical protein [Candidatus Electrothrix sp. AR4]